MSLASPRRRAHTSQRATGRFGVFSTAYVVTTALVLGMAPAAFAADPPVTASWHGRAIQEPRDQADAVAETVSLPAGWSAGPVRLGTGYHKPGGSTRVRDVQRRLWQLGFRPGPVDGLYGPNTRAAVQWFQIKHGYPADGVVDMRTLALLRQRTGAGSTAEPTTFRQPVRGKQPAVRSASPQRQPAAQPAEGGQRTAGESGSAPAALGLIAVALLLFAAPLAVVAIRRRGTTPETAPTPASGKTPKPPKTRRPNAPREPVLGPASQPAPSPVSGQPLAIGYVRGADRAALARHARTIRQACSSRGWKLADLVREDSAAGANGTPGNPALAAAMERLSEPGESRLVVSKLAHLSRSAAELTSLFEWFAQNEVQVIAADAGIDTTTVEGRNAAQVLLAKVARRQAASRLNGRNGHGANGNGANGNGANGHRSNGSGRGELAGAGSNGKG